MKTEISDNEGEVTMLISLDWDDVKEEYRELLRRYSKIPIKGFRAGAVPAKMVEAMFNKEMGEDLVNKCSDRFCRSAMQREGLHNGSPVVINNIELAPGDYFSFETCFLSMPSFDLPDYEKLDLSTEDVMTEISEKLLERTSIELNRKFVDNELAFSGIEADEATPQERHDAEQRVKLMLILKKIAVKDGITVDDRDIEERIKKMAAENDVTVEELKKYLLEGGGLSRMADYLLAEHVLGYIAEKQQL